MVDGSDGMNYGGSREKHLEIVWTCEENIGELIEINIRGESQVCQSEIDYL